MYRDYFGFQETPFSIAPDPRFLYMSELHREALAHLLYGMQTDGGFVLVSGEVGTGKTTMCRCLLEQLPENMDVAFILNPRVTTSELLASICDEFAIKYPAGNRSIKLFVDAINSFLLETHAKGRRAVVIIDEAQNLHPTVLEQVRLLTNLETSERKLLQIIMLGQPELLTMLAQPEMRQIAQRITARYHLGPLSCKEMGSYVNHRLSVAGLRLELFPPGVIRRLHRLSGGIPRLANVICDRALLGAYVQGHATVKKRTLAKAAREVLGHGHEKGHGQPRALWPRPFKALWVAASLALLVIGFMFALDFLQHRAVSVPLPAEVMQSQPLPEKEAPVALPEVDTQNVLPVETPALPVAAPPVAALAWPDDLPMAMSKTMAFRALLARWGSDFALADHDDVCQYAKRYGLACLLRRDGLDSLPKMNVPAVLHIMDDQGQDYYVTLVALHDDAAKVVVGLEERELPLEDLQAHWLGEFTLLWRPPPGYHNELTEGGKGPAVKWLQERLDVLQGRQLRVAANNRDLVFDAALKHEVEEFQLAQGLTADGIAGPQTLMRLSAFSDPGAPVLAAPAGGQ